MEEPKSFVRGSKFFVESRSCAFHASRSRQALRMDQKRKWWPGTESNRRHGDFQSLVRRMDRASITQNQQVIQ